MNIRLGLRTLALLAFVAAATAMLVSPGGLGVDHALDPALHTMLSVTHN